MRIQVRGKVVRWSQGPDFERERLQEAVTIRGEAAARRAEDAVDELLELLESCSALHLVGQVAAWATAGVPDRDDARERFGREAQVEFLGGLALSLARLEAELAGPHEVRRCLDLLDGLMEAERARLLGEEAGSGSSSLGSVLDEVRFVSRLENLLDRTQGYAPHLERMIEAVFEPLRGDSLTALGFCPADLPQLVQAYVTSRQRAFQDRVDKASRISASHLEGLPVPKEWALMSWVIFGFVGHAGDSTAHELSVDAGLPEDEVRAALEALVSEWGCQPDFRRPGEMNQFRRHPVLRGSEGRYSIPLPWSILHEIFGWFRDLTAPENLLPLLRKFHDARAAAAEALVTDTLVAVFGEDRVFPNVEYPIGAGNWAEVDALVRLGDHALVIEAKGHAISDSFRAGDVEYAENHFLDVVDKAFSQSDRAARYLGDGGERLRAKNGGPKIEWSPVSGTTRIAVSFERIDPFVLTATRLSAERQSAPPTWVVCLADLLMVADILREPYEFYAYAALRAELAANPVVALLSEADALGAFLDDGLRSYQVFVREGGISTAAMLHHHSQALNAYYTCMAAGIAVERPILRLPRALVDRLRGLDTDAPGWAAEVMRLVQP